MPTIRMDCAAQIPATIVGGIAASILGRPCLTRDIDALAILPEADWAKAIETAARHGIVPRIEGALDFAGRSRVLLMRHVASEVDLDLVFAGLPFELPVVVKSSRHDVGGALVSLPRVEDLRVMKKLLMLDEPSMGLSPAIADEIFERIVAIHRDAKLSVLLVEQRVAEALEFADRAYVLENGAVALEGNHTTLKNDDRIRRAYLGM